LGGGPLRLGLGNGDRALLGVHGILLHVGAVDVVTILCEVLPIFEYCIAHFKRTALFVFGHVRVLLEIEEGDKISRTRWLFHAWEASTGTPLVEFLTEGIVLGLDEAEFTRSYGSLTTLGVNKGDGGVDNRALRGAADCSQIW
jgi:hypothetical protein